MSRTFTFNAVKELVGNEIGVSDWLQISQERINMFAECTGDGQWIHTDKEKAKDGPFGTTVAHGYLILSLLSHFNFQYSIFTEGIKMAFNYGLNKVRFISPVPEGSRIRHRAVLKNVMEKGSQNLFLIINNTVEIEGQDKPAMEAESVYLIFL
ncbi:MAG: MaoC family dehydratase [Candidatus Aminicenantes bacterium]|jgi:acyl dehydratase